MAAEFVAKILYVRRLIRYDGLGSLKGRGFEEIGKNLNNDITTISEECDGCLIVNKSLVFLTTRYLL